jgi:hypothetical protein
MKAILLAFCLCAGAPAAPLLVVQPPTGNITLRWKYDTNELSTNLWFTIYETTNLSEPLSNWNPVLTMPGTNVSATFNVNPGEHFFVATTSNFWGETSITSNLTSTPPLPQNINDSLRIEKAP